MGVLTVEIEHIDVDVLEEVEAELDVEVHPASSTIRTIQDKFRQKVHLQSHALHIAPFLDLVEPSANGIKEAVARLGLPLMLKSKTLAYDERGNLSSAIYRLSKTPSSFSAGARSTRRSGCRSSRRSP